MAKTKKWLQWFDEIQSLGEGGNADVYLVREKDTGEKYALKELRNRNEEKRKRFLNEIQIEQENAPNIPGIIPVVMANKEQMWYTMPIAIPVMDVIGKLNIIKIVGGVVQLAETLCRLHDKKIYHRDIKPSNIYYFENRFSFGDFGLVDFPDGEDLTRSDLGLGAIFTIAPEMKRDPKHADASKADVFSLAKTLWMLLCDDERGFDGVYNYLDASHSLRYVSRFGAEHLVEIDELLKDSTENDPSLRPNIYQFKDRLSNWLMVSKDTKKSQSSDWNFLKKQLFGTIAPSEAVWRNIDSIINVLNHVGRTPAYNHMLFSDGGGLDFLSAEKAPEKDCIYLYDTLKWCFVVKPESLVFVGFDDDYRWNYFILNLKETNPIIAQDESNGYEYLVEDTPAHYVDSRYAQYGVYDYDTGIPLPEGYKLVRRYLYGKFLIVLKMGPYNQISGTYDGRHGLCDNDEFRKYINEIRSFYTLLRARIKEDADFKDVGDAEIDRRILNTKVFNKNPFEKPEKENIDRYEFRKKFEKLGEIEAYVKNHYTEWNFSEVLENQIAQENSKIKFYIEFRDPEDLWSSLIDRKTKAIRKDGSIKDMSVDELEGCYFTYCREDVVRVKNNVTLALLDLLEKQGFQIVDGLREYFTISLRRDSIPAHLFTKQEIEKEMREADDRVDNQLVIDEDGYAKVINDNGAGYLYPVCLESWNAGNNYVGKYSSLSSLDETYILCLQGWLLYLKFGEGQYMDCVEEVVAEEQLLEEIRAYY